MLILHEKGVAGNHGTIVATDALMFINKGQRSRLWIRQGLSLDAQQR